MWPFRPAEARWPLHSDCGREDSQVGPGDTSQDSERVSKSRIIFELRLTVDFLLNSIKLCYSFPLCHTPFDSFILHQVKKKTNSSNLDCFCLDRPRVITGWVMKRNIMREAN